jgi:hypothetical protein
VIGQDRSFLDRICTQMLAFEGDAHVEWFEGNFEDYEADKIRRLGPDAVEPKRIRCKKFARATDRGRHTRVSFPRRWNTSSRIDEVQRHAYQSSSSRTASTSRARTTAAWAMLRSCASKTARR